jgi:hypothetical protein
VSFEPLVMILFFPRTNLVIKVLITLRLGDIAMADAN